MTGQLSQFAFQWPWALWALALLPLGLVFYLRAVARQRRNAQALARLQWLGAAGAGARAGWTRHLPALLMGLGLLALLLAVARPQAMVRIPSLKQTVMLVLDMSGSMRATDIKPTRFAAAQAAAKRFVEQMPAHARVGVVGFASVAAVVQAPTRERESLLRAIDGLQLQRATAIGSGIVMALATAMPEAKIDTDLLINGRLPFPAARAAASAQAAASAPKADAQGTVAIVLLSDGVSNTGPDPIKMAELAADYGVRIHTVGLATEQGATLSADGWSVRVKLDEAPLKRIAAITQGEYYRAASAGELAQIYSTLSTRLAFERQELMELTALFAALGALLTALGALWSLAWFNRVL
jgi:Ca-activated chloride channel family protein